MATVREIIRGEAYASLHGAIFVESYTRCFADFCEGSVVIIVIKKICRCITGNINIRPAVVVEIRGQRREPITPRSLANSRVLRDIRKRAVTVIVVQRVSTHFESARPAHHIDPLPLAPRSLSCSMHGAVTEINLTL